MEAYLALPGNAGGVTAYGLCNAKVNQLELALHHQEVGWLEIRMHDPGLVDCLDSLQPHSTAKPHNTAG